MVELTDSTVVKSQLKTNNTIVWQCVQHKATEYATNSIKDYAFDLSEMHYQFGE
jgi:hypothetical protein